MPTCDISITPSTTAAPPAANMKTAFPAAAGLAAVVKAEAAGGGRVFGHGGLRFVLLQLIADKPAHGYELIKAIEDRLGGSYAPSPGVVYPTLTLLEELGYLSVENADGGGRKRYSITASGQEFLAANRETADAMMARMNGGGIDGVDRPARRSPAAGHARHREPQARDAHAPVGHAADRAAGARLRGRARQRRAADREDLSRLGAAAAAIAPPFLPHNIATIRGYHAHVYFEPALLTQDAPAMTDAQYFTCFHR
jgi:DNA-binding PadR family transcriptional regulator